MDAVQKNNHKKVPEKRHKMDATIELRCKLKRDARWNTRWKKAPRWHARQNNDVRNRNVKKLRQKYGWDKRVRLIEKSRKRRTSYILHVKKWRLTAPTFALTAIKYSAKTERRSKISSKNLCKICSNQ